MRDFLGKIVPGGIVLWAFSSAFCKGIIGPAEAIPFVQWIFLAGVAWLIGFAVQAISELLLWSRPILDEEAAKKQVAERIECLEQLSEAGQKDFERLIAVEEICRNGGMALALVAVAAAAKAWGTGPIVFLACGFLAIIGLFHFANYCEKVKTAYREQAIPKKAADDDTPSKGAKRKTAKKKTAKKKP